VAKKDITRFPIWVQERIRQLERNLREAEARAETFRLQISGDKETSVISNYYDDVERLFLPDHSEVRFILGGKQHTYVDVSARNDKLIVRGSRCVTISPEAGNSIRIEVEDF
jgi:hypothetical protein